MGLLDNAGNLLNRGVANAGRGTKAISLKAQIADLNRSRVSLMAQLGESLYEPTRALEEYRASREALYVSIEELDAQRIALQNELDSIERQANLATAPAPAVRCPKCGRGLSQGDAFCPGCGTSVEQARANQHLCMSCGNALGSDDMFCMNCGTPVSTPPSESADGTQAAVVEGEVEKPEQQPSELEEESIAAQGPSTVEEAPQPPLPSEAPEAPEASDELMHEEAPVEAAASVAPVEVFAPVPVALPDNIKVCPACGYHASTTAAFCRNCGNRL